MTAEMFFVLMAIFVASAAALNWYVAGLIDREEREAAEYEMVLTRYSSPDATSVTGPISVRANMFVRKPGGEWHRVVHRQESAWHTRKQIAAIGINEFLVRHCKPLEKNEACQK